MKGRKQDWKVKGRGEGKRKRTGGDKKGKEGRGRRYWPQ